MSWASQRRFKYILGIVTFFAIIIGVPAAIWIYEPESCFDGMLNQGEYSIDRGGPCKLLDERQLIPHATLWARGFEVQKGTYNGIAYVENPNQRAGVLQAPYRFKLYDEKNILVAEREGLMFIMPGAITPLFVGGIETGERVSSRAFFEFAGPLLWERLEDRSSLVSIRNKELITPDTRPRITALVDNNGVKDLRDLEIIAVAFDGAGNAFAASSTVIPLLESEESQVIAFTWPLPFERRAARIDVLPSISPVD
jgi:hypothetical protein